MLLVGVGGQVLGGAVSDRSGRKETILAGMAATALFLAGFLVLPGPAGLVCLMLFGFSLWSSFSVTLAIAHEFLPGNLGLASGLLLGLSMGFGGLGVALIGGIGDAVGLAGAFWALLLITVLAIPLFLILPYPWRAKENDLGFSDDTRNPEDYALHSPRASRWGTFAGLSSSRKPPICVPSTGGYPWGAKSPRPQNHILDKDSYHIESPKPNFFHP